MLQFLACLGTFGNVSWYVFWVWYGTCRHVFFVCFVNLGICSGMAQYGLLETVEVYVVVWYGMF